jgi:GAF domain-containing protein
VFVPLAIEGQVLGVLSIQSRRRKAFGARDLHLLQVLAAALTIRLALTSMHAEVATGRCSGAVREIFDNHRPQADLRPRHGIRNLTARR